MIVKTNSCTNSHILNIALCFMLQLIQIGQGKWSRFHFN